MANDTTKGWHPYKAHALRHGMTLMIDECDLANVIGDSFRGPNVDVYIFTNLPFPISADGTYYDSNGDVIRKITAVRQEGFLNEAVVD